MTTLLPTSATVTRQRSYGLHCRIGGHLYRLIDRPGVQTVIETALPQPPRIDTAANPEDFRPEAGAIWSMSDWKGGEGQAFFHRQEATPDRFWDSAGVDVAPPTPGSPIHLSLLHSTSLIRASDSTRLPLVYDGAAIYSTDDEEVIRSTDPLAPTPSFTTESPHAGEGAVDVLDLAVLGDEVYAALSTNGIHVRSNTGTWTHFSDLPATRIWEVKGRILAAVGNALHEAKSLATSDLLHTLAPGHAFTDVTDAGDFILASATDGTIYAFTLNEDSSALILTTRTRVSQNSQITALAFHPAGLVFYGTGEKLSDGIIGRLYRAGFTEQGAITFSQLIRQWGHEGEEGGGQNHAPRAIVPYRESVYTCAAEHDAGVSLWRYDLETTGRVRHISHDVHGHCDAILPLADRLLFTVSNPDGMMMGDFGIIREDADTYVPVGYVISPLADHFNASQKNWVGALIDVAVLNGGFVELWYSTDHDAILDPTHSSWVRARRIHSTGQIDEVPIAVRSRYIAAKVVLIAAGAGLGSATPLVRSFSFRSFISGTDILLTLPINTGDEVEIPGLRRIRTNGLGRHVYDSLKDIEGTNQEVILYDPPETLFGFVEKITTPVLALTSRGSRTLASIVTVRATRTGSVSTSSSLLAEGLNWEGVAIEGGTEKPNA